MRTLRFDLVIVGAGMAGLSAALRAAEFGLKVAVLERGTGERYLCNTRWSGGVLHLAFRDVKAPVPSLYESVMEATRGQADPGLVQVLVQDAARAVDWLGTQGAKYIRMGAFEYQRWMLAPPRRLGAGQDWEGRGPDQLLRTMARNLVQQGGELRTGTAALALVERGGRCAGVEARDAAGPLLFESQAVLLADGGFQGNPDLLRQHVSVAPQKLHQRGASTGVGDGLRMAQALGAHVADLSYFYGHLLSRDAFDNPNVWPYPQIDEMATAGIVVDENGRRFADEGRGGVYLANAVAKLADPLKAWVIFDHAIWEGPGRAARIPANPHLETAGATMLKAGSLEALAAMAGLPVGPLQSTVAALRQAWIAGKSGELMPPRSLSRGGRAWMLDQAPYYAVPVCAGITYTFGGISIDKHARVRSMAGAPIPGLYAAGSTTAGIEGVGAPGYVGGLMKSLVFGLRGAEHVRQEIR